MKKNISENSISSLSNLYDEFGKDIEQLKVITKRIENYRNHIKLKTTQTHDFIKKNKSVDFF